MRMSVRFSSCDSDSPGQYAGPRLFKLIFSFPSGIFLSHFYPTSTPTHSYCHTYASHFLSTLTIAPSP